MLTFILWLGIALGATDSIASATFGGQLKSSSDYYPYHLSDKTKDLSPYLSVELTEKYKFNKRIRFQARALGLTNPESQYSPEKLYGDLPEAFLELKSSDFKLRGGMDTVNWGLVDVSSPSDVINPQALFHPLRSYRRGAPMVEALWDKQVIGFHLIYIPRQQAPLLPSKDSRWLPRRSLLNLSALGTKIVLPSFIEYDYLPSVTLDHALDHNAGIKLTSHLDGWDFQVTHFEGVAPSPKVTIPDIHINTDPTMTYAAVVSPIQLAPLYYRVRTTGLGISWAREKWIYRFESAYQHSISSHPFVQPWMWSNVFAVETNVPVGTTTMTWLAQFYYTKNPQAADNMISSNYRIFDRTAILGTRWALSDDVTITASVLYEIEQMGFVLMGGFEQKLSESLKWGLGWRNFSASKDGVLKTYSYNNHGTLDLTYYF